MNPNSIDVDYSSIGNDHGFNYAQVNVMPKNNFAFFKSGNEIFKIFFSEIIYAQSDHVYVHLMTTTKKILLRAKLEEIEKYLPSSIFHRIHQRYIINIEHVTRLNNDDVILDKLVLPFSKKYRKSLLANLIIFT